MARQSAAKKVARAARTGGGRTSRGRASTLWYFTLVAICVAGIALVAFSRQQRQDELAGPATKEAPTTRDHWHVAYGVYVCDRWLPAVEDQRDPDGIHTHADGVIHVHPLGARAAGRNATFGRFADAIGAKVSPTSFDWPGSDRKSNGDQCGDKPGEVKAWFNGDEHDGNPRSIHLGADRGELVLAFVPDDVTLEQIGRPPSVSVLDNLSDVPAAPPLPAEGGVPPGQGGGAPGGDPAAPPAGAEPGGAPDPGAPATTAAP